MACLSLRSSLLSQAASDISRGNRSGRKNLLKEFLVSEGVAFDALVFFGEILDLLVADVGQGRFAGIEKDVIPSLLGFGGRHIALADHVGEGHFLGHAALVNVDIALEFDDGFDQGISI